jgi:F-type H+-transporting ATPase subunit b
MPQFDPTTFAPQLFWLAITFVLLYVLMSKIALPRIGEVLDERQRRIDDNLDKAAQLKAEAEAAVAAYEKALAESRAHAQAVIREAMDRLAKQSEQRHKDLAEKLAAQIKAGEARIAGAKEQALTHVRDVAVDVARAAAGKLLGKEPDDAKLDKAIGAAMQEKG